MAYSVATMMVTYFYFMKRCASLRFQKFESLIFFHARSEYGSTLVEDYHNKICEPDLMQLSQLSAYTTGLLEQYIHNLALCNLNQRAYQLPREVFSETDCKLYYAQCYLSILDPPTHCLFKLVDI